MDIEERTRELERKAQRNEWRIDALDEWRRVQVEPQLADHRSKLDGLVKAEDIAEAVAEKMREGRTIKLTRVQTAVAVLSLAAAWSAPIAVAVHG